jgi:hypothetical protein
MADPQTLHYSTIVAVDMDQTNGVNLADAAEYGHRLIIDVSLQAMDEYLRWERVAGTDKPSAVLGDSSGVAAAIAAGISAGFDDIDGVTGELHFGSAVISAENPDPRLRAGGQVSANDIPLAFVLYKLYGSSTAATAGRVYNLEDAHGMLTNQTIIGALTSSFQAEEGGALTTMFRDLLAANPQRFFDASGNGPPGLFETGTSQDISGSGGWGLVAGDTFEIRIRLVFKSQVTRRGADGTGVQIVIAPNDFFYVRLQLRAA